MTFILDVWLSNTPLPSIRLLSVSYLYIYINIYFFVRILIKNVKCDFIDKPCGGFVISLEDARSEICELYSVGVETGRTLCVTSDLIYMLL